MGLRTKNTKRTETTRFSPAKDKVFKTLAHIIEFKGFKVRREELKAGPGWRASSGACRAREDKLIFVERRLPQDDQLNFLIATILELNIPLSADELADLPEATRQVLLAPRNLAA